MSTKCFTCTELISNGDFIKCEGLCAQKFHSKCVSLNKATLNAITSCPNVHWLCHECNNGNKMIGTSIDNMSNAVDSLKKSLSSDLLTGFKLLTETLSSSLSSTNRSSINLCSDNNNSTKRRREEAISDSENEKEPTTRKKRFTATPNNRSNSYKSTAVREPNFKSTDKRRPMVAAPESNKRKSVVISNIDKGISPAYLSNYLANELHIDESTIRTTLLKPSGIADESIKFLQFRISVPESIYYKVRAPDTWPTGVRVRDYVFNRRGGNAPTSVSKSNFLSKRASHAPIDQRPVETLTIDSTETSSIPEITIGNTTLTSNVIETTNFIESAVMEESTMENNN